MSDNHVTVVMLHAAAYATPILDMDGNPTTKEVEFFGAKMTVPAMQNVYLHDGEVEVPEAIAEILIANGSARYPTVTTIATPTVQAGLASAPTTDSKVATRASKAAKAERADADVSLN